MYGMEDSRQDELDSDVRNAVVGSKAVALDLLLEKVYRDSGYDFREYKRGTVTRRLQRRLYATGVRTYLEYMRFLDTHPEEYQRLADDLTIKVSGFFRSPYTFQQVAGLVLPELISHKRTRGQQSLNVWSAACARGEEPYSIAILLAEFLRLRLGDFDIAIYATDISASALAEAQTGTYKNIEGISDAILESYFNHRGEGYIVRSDIRQMVKFSHFDLASTKIPPFTNLDCIFCCNVLIYLQKQLQERVLDMLYNSLATPGYLVLGEAETPTDSLRGKLECLDAKARIYKKNGRSDNV
jgi:two-component system CheB/CheR fusion protein